MTNSHAKALGKLGGQATLKKYGKAKLKEWGLKGGRPKKNRLVQRGG